MNTTNGGQGQTQQQQVPKPRTQSITEAYGDLVGSTDEFERPAQYYLEWKAKSNEFKFWDKEIQDNKTLKLPYSIQILDFRYTIKGFSQKLGTGIYTNEVQNFTEPMILKRHPYKKKGEKEAKPLAIITDFQNQQGVVKSYFGNINVVIYIIDQYGMRNALIFQGKKQLQLVENYINLQRPFSEGVTLQPATVDSRHGRLHYCDFVPNPNFISKRNYNQDLEFLSQSYKDYSLKVQDEIIELRTRFNDDMSLKPLDDQPKVVKVAEVKQASGTKEKPIQQPPQGPVADNPFANKITDGPPNQEEEDNPF